MNTRTAPISADELAELFESNPPCEFHIYNSRTGKITETCDNGAEWVHVCRYCGYPGLICDAHHHYLLSAVTWEIRCKACLATGTGLAEVVISMRRI